MLSLIRAFASRLNIVWELSYLLTEHHLDFLLLKGGCTGSSESIHVKMPCCWKSHVAAQISLQEDLIFRSAYQFHLYQKVLRNHLLYIREDRDQNKDCQNVMFANFVLNNSSRTGICWDIREYILERNLTSVTFAGNSLHRKAIWMLTSSYIWCQETYLRT